MDKITRLLLLYSKLSRGEKVNKLNFCLDTGISSRAFDRDIEDIRLYLSELFYVEELIYNRRENVYYLSNTQRQPLEIIEYLFIKRILLDTGMLCNAEMEGILMHLAQNTENAGKVLFNQNEDLKTYHEPVSRTPILKMNGDLQTVIKNKSVIEIRYTKMDGTKIIKTLIPCMVRYESGYFCLIAYHQENGDPYTAHFRLDRIYSFSIVREQTTEEKIRVMAYFENYYLGTTHVCGEVFSEIILRCSKEYYPLVYNKYRNVEMIEEETDTVILKINTFENGFAHWVLSLPTEHIQVLSPQAIKVQISLEAKKLLKQYTEAIE